MTLLYICRGLPASGKTTWARQWVAKDTAHRARVNKDDLRRLLHDGVYLGSDTENVVNMIRDEMIRSLLRSGIDVVNDDTNLPQILVDHLTEIGRREGAEVAIHDLTHISMEECMARDKERENSVGPEVIYRLAQDLNA